MNIAVGQIAVSESLEQNTLKIFSFGNWHRNIIDLYGRDSLQYIKKEYRRHENSRNYLHEHFRAIILF